jgi:dihydrofolate synthase/folylpolyglutamate synthase
MSEDDYYDALRALAQPIRAGDYPRTLRPMRQLLAELGNPQRRFPAVVVAGSVGKGTTCHHIARLLRAADLHVGLYTSPHLHSFRERFVLNGKMISKETFVEGARMVREAARRFDHVYSMFEQATALALWWYAQQRVDIAVLEIGLGGRWDAVNAVPNTLAVFTPIETEHLDMLGGSLQSIIWQKAGIIQPRGQAITGRQSGDVYAILQHEADSRQATLHRVDAGEHAGQEEAAGLLAFGAYRNLAARGIVPQRMPRLDATFAGLPGRLERVQVAGRTVLLDGAHTPGGAWTLRLAIHGLLGRSRPVRLIVGMLQDKHARKFLAAFDAPNYHIVLTQAPSHRALSAEQLRRQTELRHAEVELIPNLHEALSGVYGASEALVVVTGSLRMIAVARETYGLLSPDELAEARRTREIFEGPDYLARLNASRN